jgi:hypothetical protein
LLLLGELQIRRTGTDQHRGAAEHLPHGLAEIVLDVGTGLWVTNFQ